MISKVNFPLPPFAPFENFGVNLSWPALSDDRVVTVDHVGKIVRIDVRWSLVVSKLDATGNPVYDFSMYDKLVAQALSLGWRLVLIHGRGNTLYGMADDQHAPIEPKSRMAFLEFVRVTTVRYAGLGILWELWNEPDLVDGNGNRQFALGATLDQILELCTDIAWTIRKTCNTEWIIGVGMSWFDVTVVQAMIAHGLHRWIDVLSGHLYVDYAKQDPEVNQLADMQRCQQSIAAATGNPNFPIAITESGVWPTQSDGYKLTPQDIVDRIIRQYCAGFKAKAVLYVHYGAFDPVLGLCSEGGVHQPQYDMVKALMRGATTVGRIVKPVVGVPVLTAWTPPYQSEVGTGSVGTGTGSGSSSTGKGSGSPVP